MSYSYETVEKPYQALARELGDNAESDLGLAALRYVKRWEITKNPHWIDLAVVTVTEADQPLPPCLQILASHIAKRRINGMEAAAGGATALMEEIKGHAFACMAFLIGANGASVSAAAVDAANATAAVFGSPLLKASTLERDYGKGRKSEFLCWERLLKDASLNEAGTLDILLEHLKALPTQDPGNRRD